MHTRVHKYTNTDGGEHMDVHPQESAAHVVTVFYGRCPGTVGGDKLYVCVMSV